MKPGKNTMLLYGRNSVLERLKANPRSIKKIFLQDNFDVPQIQSLIREKGIPVKSMPSRNLAGIKPARDLQGIIASVDIFEYTSFKNLLKLSPGNKPTFIFLDKLFDPQNLGVIIRTAACFGGFAIVIPRFEACEVTEAVLHVASGGENYVPVSKVSNIAGAVIEAKKAGYWIMGGVLDSGAKDINEISIPFPLGLVLGSEGKGIRYGVEKQLDIKARIPMRGEELSFNVAMACAIFCHEISKQKGRI